MTTVLQTVDIYVQPKPQQQFTSSASVIIAPRKSAQDSTLFWLAIEPGSAAEYGNAGALGVHSSAFALGAFMQYWSYQLLDDNTFERYLTDNHTAEAIALNLLNVPTEIAPHIEMPMPQALAEGAYIVGWLDGDRLVVRVSGATAGGTTQFVTEIVADREQ